MSSVLFASGAFLAGCSGSTEQGEAIDEQHAALVAIPSPNPNINYKFGTSVAADDTTLIVGDDRALAPGADGGLRNRGEVHVYTRGSSVESWTELQTLKPFGPIYQESHHGSNLALHGNLLVVSANRDALDCGTYPCANMADDNSQGGFYVYRRTAPGQPFTQVGTKYSEPTPIPNGRFGLHVATNGKYIAAAAGIADPGDSMDVRIYTIQANGSITYSYGIDPTLKPLGLAMTENGVLAVIPGNSAPVLRTYRLQASQAVPLTNSLGSGYVAVTASGNTIAAVDGANGGRVVLAPVSAAGVGAVTTLASLGLAKAGAVSLLENQRLFIADQDSHRAKVVRYDLAGGTWTNVGSIHPPLTNRLVANGYGFAAAMAQRPDFLAFGDIWRPTPTQRVYVSSIATNSNLADATFDKQRFSPTDSCGTSCGSQSFAGAEFGRESALSGDVAALTQPDLNNGAVRSPSVHIYTRQSGVWSRTGAFNYAGKRTRDVAVDSGRVYVGVGTPGSAPGTYSDGAVLVYERNASQVWQLVATLTASDPTSLSGRQVGDFVAASGNVVAAGAFGSVYLFQRASGGTWSQLQKLPVAPLSASLGFPHAVALSDTYLVVGAPYDNSVNPGEGSAFVYRRSDWGLDQKLTSGSIGPGVQRYGYSVAVDGTTVLVGAPDGGATNGGYVDVRERTGSGATPWEYATRLALDERGFDYRVGTSVSLAGNLALVGAVGDPLTGGGSGAAYLFARVGGTWNPINGHHLLPSDYGQLQAAFGWGVQLSGATALVTAPQTKGAVGAAYFYDGLADADSDGLLAADDCNDTDGIAVSCVLGAANLSFEPAPRPQWSADSGSFTLSTTHTDGITAAKLGTGVAKLSSPLFSTTLLREIGSALAIDIQRPSTGSNAVTLFYSVPALNISQQVIGTVDLSSFPTGTWKTAALPLPTALRNVLAGQSTNVRFHLQFNAGAPNLLLDNLRFTGTFIPRAPAPPPGTVSATLTTTSSASNNYCMALKLGNSGSSPTSSWSVVINTQGTTITSNWNAAFSGTTGTVTLTSNQPFNSSIPAGSTAHDPSVGFCANRAAGSGAVASVVSASGQ